jgi:pyruvate kinase
MIEAGVNLFRFNLSHKSNQFEKTIQIVRSAADELKTPIAIIADLQGPKIRIGRFEHDKITLTHGQSFSLYCEKSSSLGNEHGVFVDYSQLYKDVRAGDKLLLDDGLIELYVESIENQTIHCKVISGGVLSNNKGINRRGGGLTAKTLTKKDLQDIAKATQNDIDYLAISFTKDANDIKQARKEIEKHGATTSIIAKIERSEALDNLDEIILAADAVMVARGDLGVEIGAAEVPAVQKEIIKRARLHDKAVITATQMMESMIKSPQPTRAEVSDVANAILDGSDAVLLTAETASGQYPVKVIEMINKVCLSTEKYFSSTFKQYKQACRYSRSDEAISMATMFTANHFPIKAIVALTESGTTPLWMSRDRSNIPIYALTRNLKTLRKMTLFSNVFPLYFDFSDIDLLQLDKKVIVHMKALGLLNPGDLILFTRGSELYQPGHTNTMQILKF